MAIATVTLVIYLFFLFTQRFLFHSRCFDSDLPWSSLERRLEILKIIAKVVVSVDFMYDKLSTSAGYVNLICFAIFTVIILNRLTRGIIFDNSIYCATILYETLQAWIFLCIGISRLS